MNNTRVIMSVLILLSNLGVLALILYNAKKWPTVVPRGEEVAPCVSVLIPARNEERHVRDALQSVVGQSGVMEILVYDDHSTDGTAEAVRSIAHQHPVVRLIEPVPLPEGWYGKPFACFELASRARGRWLLFLDADARLAPNAVPAMVAAAEDYLASMMSFWPRLAMESTAEKIFMPLLNFVVFSMFPAPLSFTMNLPSLGLAHGACILADRETYHRVGGHARVKTELFEDTALARVWRVQGQRSLCLDGQFVVRVRMYDSLRALWRGFEKIVFPAFRRKTNFWLCQTSLEMPPPDVPSPAGRPPHTPCAKDDPPAASTEYAALPSAQSPRSAPGIAPAPSADTPRRSADSTSVRALDASAPLPLLPDTASTHALRMSVAQPQ